MNDDILRAELPMRLTRLFVTARMLTYSIDHGPAGGRLEDLRSTRTYVVFRRELDEMTRWLSAAGVSGSILAEAESEPRQCRKENP